MNIAEIVKETLPFWLREHGFDGVYNKDFGCCCRRELFKECEHEFEHCEPGVLVPCVAECLKGGYASCICSKEQAQEVYAKLKHRKFKRTHNGVEYVREIVECNDTKLVTKLVASDRPAAYLRTMTYREWVDWMLDAVEVKEQDTDATKKSQA